MRCLCAIALPAPIHNPGLVPLPPPPCVQDPDGVPRSVFPRVLSIVMDDPESKEVFGVKGGSCSHPCEICWVPHDKLDDMNHADWPERTAGQLVRGLMSFECHTLCAAALSSHGVAGASVPQTTQCVRSSNSQHPPLNPSGQDL